MKPRTVQIVGSALLIVAAMAVAFTTEAPETTPPAEPNRAEALKTYALLTPANGAAEAIVTPAPTSSEPVASFLGHPRKDSLTGKSRPVEHPKSYRVTWSRHTPQAASIPTQIVLRCGEWEREVTLPLDVMKGEEWSPCAPEIDAPVGLGVKVTVEVVK